MKAKSYFLFTEESYELAICEERLHQKAPFSVLF